MLGICRHEHDDADGSAERRARSHDAVARRAHRATAAGRARAGDAGDRHLDNAGAARSDRRAARGQDCAAARRERSCAQGEERSLRQLRLPAAARGEDARHVGGHQRHADIHSRRSVLQRHGDRDRRFSNLRRRARAPWPGVGIRRIAQPARQCRALGVNRRREALREERRGRPIRFDSRSDEPVADDSRIDRPSHRARSRGRPGSELRRHQLCGAAGENDRQAEIRPASS